MPVPGYSVPSKPREQTAITLEILLGTAHRAARCSNPFGNRKVAALERQARAN